MKQLDLKKSVYELTEAYPELIPVLKELGFMGVISPLVRKTIGRTTTIPKGAAKQGKDLAEVIRKLEAAGFTVQE
ncbi:MAG TPA: DUF1858 domain-containing protein [Dehalococcoidia bacterium]|nr:DUF1858 domain-containing protein [Dehalococcoidia bacterium]